MKKVLIYIITFLFSQSLPAQQQVNDLLKKGNDFYKKQEYAKAEEQYKSILAIEPNNTKALYNLGLVQSKTAKLKEAAETFKASLDTKPKDDLKQKINYNKGTLLAKQKDYQQAAEDLKASLRLNPSDEDARQNLQRVLNELKKQQQQKQQQDQKQDNKKKKEQKKPPPKLNKQQVQQLLQSIQQQEKQVQEKMQKQKASDKKNPKDW